MQLPQNLLSHQLPKGESFGSYIAGKAPTIHPLPTTEIEALSLVWTDRLEHALFLNDTFLAERSQNILDFISAHPDGTILLIWTNPRAAVLYNPNSQKYLFMSIAP